jgi:hypothetical protein
MDFNTLKKALVVLGVLLLAMITFYATLMIGGLVVGTISNTATAGTIPVSGAMNTSLSGVEGDYITQSDALAGNVPLVIGLVAVIVIVLIFFGKRFNLGNSGGNSGLN